MKVDWRQESSQIIVILSEEHSILILSHCVGSSEVVSGLGGKEIIKFWVERNHGGDCWHLESIDIICPQDIGRIHRSNLRSQRNIWISSQLPGTPLISQESRLIKLVTTVAQVLSNSIGKHDFQIIEHGFGSNELLHYLIGHASAQLSILGEVCLNVLPRTAGARAIHGVYPLIEIVLAYAHSICFIIEKLLGVSFGDVEENTIFQLTVIVEIELVCIQGQIPAKHVGFPQSLFKFSNGFKCLHEVRSMVQLMPSAQCSVVVNGNVFVQVTVVLEGEGESFLVVHD